MFYDYNGLIHATKLTLKSYQIPIVEDKSIYDNITNQLEKQLQMTSRNVQSRQLSDVLYTLSLVGNELFILIALKVLPSYLKSSTSANHIPTVNTQAWLLTLTDALENLPISITIATASHYRKGFPLVYANKKYEDMCGYSRFKIFNQNTKKYIQDKKLTEKDSIKQINLALNTMTSIKIKIININQPKNTKFINYLSLKPIVDNNNTYRYVIGMQFDATDELNGTLINLQLSNILFHLLPDITVVTEQINGYRMSFGLSGKEQKKQIRREKPYVTH